MLQRDGPIRIRGSPAGVAYPSFTKSLVGPAPCLLVSLVLLAGGWFCHVEAQRAEMAATLCLRAMEAIRATRVLATQWSAEVARVRSEVDGNIDVLTEFSGRMGHRVENIHDSQSALPNRPAGIDDALNNYLQRLTSQEEYIERFKSSLTLFRNSRRFVPMIGGQLAESARDGGRYGQVETAARQVLGVVQSLLEQPVGDWRQRMEQAMRMLVENADGTPLRAQAEALNKHVHSLLRHHEMMERHFEEIVNSDLEDRATRIIDLLNVDYQRSETKRRYFNYGLRVSLGLALIYWAALIVRWAGRRQKGKAASRAPDTAPAERFKVASRTPEAVPAEGFEAASRAPEAAPAEEFEAASRAPDTAPAEGLEAASRTPEATPAEGFPKPSDMDMALATRGGFGILAGRHPRVRNGWEERRA